MKTDVHGYRCLTCHEPLFIKDGNLSCKAGHVVFVDENIPIFSVQDDGGSEYSIRSAVEIHENALAWLFLTFGGSEEQLRRDLVANLNLEKGQRVLVTGVGAGNDLPYIAEAIGSNGKIIALDFAKPMLDEAVQRVNGVYNLSGYDIDFCLCDATELPFEDDFFDAAYHFGGINLFSDTRQAMGEMSRVVKEGGVVVVSDEGIAPWMRETRLGKMLINNNPLYAYEAPLNYVPEHARNVKLSWLMRDCFYVISFNASSIPKEVRLDIPHKGRRGGTIESRYGGVLEGIAPSMKDHIYRVAEDLNVSRVDLIESLLSIGLEHKKGNPETD